MGREMLQNIKKTQKKKDGSLESPTKQQIRPNLQQQPRQSWPPDAH